MSLVKDVHQGLSKQVMEETYSYDQGYTPRNTPPYQHHAPQYNVHHSNGFGDAYYGYEDPPPPYPPSQGNFEDIFQVLFQERKEFWETRKRLEAQLATLAELVTRLVTLSVAKEVEEENVYQEVADEDKESKGIEIIQSASSEVTPPESPSKLYFEVLDKKEMDSLGMNESRFIACGESEFKSYSRPLYKPHNNRVKVGALNLRKQLGT
ncbi:hypothetical protein PIB30_048857 [Stylosanthes scabra]|uniref:Uncharacterized protein n=1 Tax=Stylosanthes scabra TaxID=79078 RepID=A0ABU6XEU9_9FABA|nr:hypothetical protein [Stylosanthes scabra]